MTSIRRRPTRHRLRTNTCTELAGIDRRASIAVIADHARWLVRIAANARRRIARPRDVALIQWRTWYRIRSRAKTRLARIQLCARVAVIARCTIHSVWIGTHSRHCIANTCNMARIGCRTGHRVCPGARTGLTRIRLRTTIAVVARRPIALGRIRTNSRARITRAGNVALIQRHTRDWTTASTNAGLARIRLRACIPVTA